MRPGMASLIRAKSRTPIVTAAQVGVQLGAAVALCQLDSRAGMTDCHLGTLRLDHFCFRISICSGFFISYLEFLSARLS
jgi:hypothetical protein